MSKQYNMSTVIDFLIPELQAELATQQHNATGTASASLVAERDDEGYLIKGVGYLYWVNYGRKAGKWPPLDVIRRWVELKGIASGKAVASVAFLIGRAIMRKGTPAKPYVAWGDGNSIERKDFITRTILRNNDKIVEAVGKDWEGIVFEKFNLEASKAT